MFKDDKIFSEVLNNGFSVCLGVGMYEMDLWDQFMLSLSLFVLKNIFGLRNKHKLKKNVSYNKV